MIKKLFKLFIMAVIVLLMAGCYGSAGYYQEQDMRSTIAAQTVGVEDINVHSGQIIAELWAYGQRADGLYVLGFNEEPIIAVCTDQPDKVTPYLGQRVVINWTYDDEARCGRLFTIGPVPRKPAS